MATNVPVTIWQPTPGNGEMSTQAVAAFTTIAGAILTTLAGVTLTSGVGVYTKIPNTIWTEDDGS